jgi:diguanylate cyclase (GGDEF)-like protein
LADTAVPVSAEWVVVAEPGAGRASQLAGLFTSAGFSVQIARNGDEIAPLLERVPPPALLVVQLNMPVVDGLKVLEGLLRSERKIPVLALTSVRKLRDAAVNLGVDVLSVMPSESSVLEVASTAARLLGRDSLRATRTRDRKTADRLSAFDFDASGSSIQRFATALAHDLTDAFETAFAVVGITAGGRTWVGLSAGPLAAPVSPTVRFLEWPLVKEACEGGELLIIPDLGSNAAFRPEPWPPAGTFRGVAVMPMTSRTGASIGAACLLEFGPLAMDAAKMTTFEARVRARTTEIERALETETVVHQMQTFRRQFESQRAEDDARIATLSHAALRDPLTGLFNRRGGEEALTREAARLQRTRSRASVLLLDIDHFKRINDTHGHAGGDRAIIEVGHVLQRLQRASDITVRWGGDEFLIVLPDNGEDGARIFGERVRAAVEASDFKEFGRLTVSGGAAEFQPGEKPSATVARADQDLFAAKAEGRNRVHRVSESHRAEHGGIDQAFPPAVQPRWTAEELAEMRRRRDRLPENRTAAPQTDGSPSRSADERRVEPVATRSPGPAVLPSTTPGVPPPGNRSGAAPPPPPLPSPPPSPPAAAAVPPAAIVEPPQEHAQEHELPDELADAPLLVPERSLWRWIVLGLLVAALIAGLVYAIAF